MNYPNGQKFIKSKSKGKSINKAYLTAANRGMSLEEDINISNNFYNEKNIALITKRPTPINVVKVDYSKGAKIVNAYFEKQSTTDYNGVYKGKYIDFEAKSTLNKTSFPLSNISKHQIIHLSRVIEHGGIAFFIIQFTTIGEVYLTDAKYIINWFYNGKRKSIPYQEIKNNSSLIKQGILPRLYYLEIVDKIYNL